MSRVPGNVSPQEGSDLAKVNSKVICPPLWVFLALWMHHCNLCPHCQVTSLCFCSCVSSPFIKTPAAQGPRLPDDLTFTHDIYSDPVSQ